MLHFDRRVLLYDKNPIIVGVWDFLIHASVEEIMSLPLIFDHVDDLHLPQEARWLVGFWVNKATTQPSKRPSAWMRKYGDQQMGLYWSKPVRERIASQLRYIRDWKVSECSYERIPDMRASWFIDAPYDNQAGESYTYGRRRIDYQQLAGWCRSRSGQVIACENLGADWLPFRELGTFNGQRKQSTEVLWTNEPDHQPLERQRPVEALALVNHGVVDQALLSGMAQDSARRIGNYAIACLHEIS